MGGNIFAKENEGHGIESQVNAGGKLNEITYTVGNKIGLDDLIELYIASTLGERRPVHDRQKMSAMLVNANLVVAAWDGELLVGIARSLTDWVYVTYLSDLAVRLAYQRKGIGKELIRRTQAECPLYTSLILLSSPKAVEYYRKIGMTPHPAAFWLPMGQRLLE